VHFHAAILLPAFGSLVAVDRLILAELSYVLRSVYDYDKQDILLAYDSLLGDDRFVVSDRSLVERTVKLFGSEKPLAFEDCWLLSLKQNGNVQSVATFDANLAKRT